MRVLNAAQMHEADRRTIDDIGVPAIALMETAGRAVVAAMTAKWGALTSKRIVIVCGTGNNGGDGCVVARTLAALGGSSLVLLIGQRDRVRGDARVALESARRIGVEITEVTSTDDWAIALDACRAADLVVDALCGTGLRGPLTGLPAQVVTDLNHIGRLIVAIDVPSGLSADTSAIAGPAVRAALTVTIAAPKLCHVMAPADETVGELVIADIGIPMSVIASVPGPRVEFLEAGAMQGVVPARAADSHKGDYGRVLVVAGSTGKTGAASLSAFAALRAGAGLVTVATPAGCLATIAALGAEYMTTALDEAGDGGLAASAAAQVLAMRADVIAIGPGLGRAASTLAAVRQIVANATVPLVLDADAIVAFAGQADALRARAATVAVLTPHPGEMAMLIGDSIDIVQAHRLDVARRVAASGQAYVVLKGHRSVIASPGGDAAINSTGNPAMATAGSGDVLTGVIAACLAQMPPEVAVRAATFVHGLAGDFARARQGDSLIAGDLLVDLPAAMRTIRADEAAADDRAHD